MATPPIFLQEIMVRALANLHRGSLAQAIAVCRAWRIVGDSDDLWSAVVMCQWRFSQKALSVRFSGGWREICQTFCKKGTASLASWFSLHEEQQSVLEQMSTSAQILLSGLAHGYVPTSDGLFTYHCPGATPVHYRHSVGEVFDSSAAGGLRVGGVWNWSPDRVTWFPTTTCDISRGLLGSSGWQLVSDNLQIVNFLNCWPLLPLIVGDFSLWRAESVVSHLSLNEIGLEHFVNSLSPAEPGMPSTSCMRLKMFTVHFHLLPALHLICTEQGFSIAEITRVRLGSGSVPEEFTRLLSKLNEAHRSCMNMPPVPLPKYICQYDRWFRRERLQLPEEQDPLMGM